jgi:hypothetical protein
MLDSPKSLILAALAPVPGQPAKALRQYGWPYSDKWGFDPGPHAPIQTFEDRDVRRLYIDGLLSFVSGQDGTAAVLADAGVPRPEYSFRAELDARDQQIRRLRVGDGPTFDELYADGKAGGGICYRFDDLLRIDAKAPVPPLVFIHIPRTAGTTLNNLLMRNYKFRADSYGSSFFPPYFPSHFLSLVEPPTSPDDRQRPAFFTGHIDFANDIFRYMPRRYVTVTVLRDPIDRIVSHYRFNSTQPSVFQTAIREEGLDVLAYLNRLGEAIPQQHELFSPGSRLSGTARVEEALNKLETSVSLFGLQEDFDRFASMLGSLLGFADLTCKKLNKLPPGAAEVTTQQRKRCGRCWMTTSLSTRVQGKSIESDSNRWRCPERY